MRLILTIAYKFTDSIFIFTIVYLITGLFGGNCLINNLSVSTYFYQRAYFSHNYISALYRTALTFDFRNIVVQLIIYVL